ncbi:class F sortase [Demequina sp. NBRC 110056]|uniref:class F sortase n=1 Tax=Demequina sp. NBRC 110056 TaxID=1570345 RepID=UPI000A0052A5|nr:class F sortase [Demequina sp. NBRC 110056]
MRALIAATVLLLVSGCAAVGGDATPGSAPRESSPTPRPADADQVGTVRAPTVLGDVPIASTDPDTVAALRSEPPQRLVIDGLELDMSVVDVGLAEDGSMEIPADADVAGWYRFGPAPGSDAGNAVLAAHVDDARGVGPFASLRDLDAGDAVTVVDASGEAHGFVVDRVEQTSKREVDMDLVFDRDTPGQLVLVTCGGRFDWDARHYEDNVVVYATPVEEPSR